MQADRYLDELDQGIRLLPKTQTWDLTMTTFAMVIGETEGERVYFPVRNL